MPVEIRQVFKTAGIAYLGNILILLHQHVAGMADPDFGHLFGKCSPGMVVKITRKRNRGHIQHTRNFPEIDFMLVVFNYKFKNLIDTLRTFLIIQRFHHPAPDHKIVSQHGL